MMKQDAPVGLPTPGTEPPDSPEVEALLRVRTQLDLLEFPLLTATSREAAGRRDAVLHQIDDYLVPRLRRLDAPLLAVVGGSTGAGKSTLVNSLLRVQVTRPGVLRPTTRSPVLVHHPTDKDWFGGRRVLPGLARDYGAEEILGPGDPITAMRLVESEALPAGLALLDAPDIDSVVQSNRAVAAQLLAAADLWIFVTTASRYADAVPWGFLQEASERSAALCVVLNRVPRDAIGEVRDDLAKLLAANGLGATPVFTISELPTDEGLLPREAVVTLGQWLAALASDGEARALVVRRTLTGALAVLGTKVADVAAAADEQSATAARLIEAVQGAHSAALDRFESSMSDGSMLRGEVLARWQEVVGTGDFMRQIEGGIGRARDKVVDFFRGRAASERRLGESLGSATHVLITSEVSAANAETARLWAAEPAGADLIASHPGIDRTPEDLGPRVERLVRDWQGAVLDLVREQGAGKRAAARGLSLGVNGAGVALMLVVFSTTGGLTFTEAGIAAGTAALSQRLLEAVFGDQAVRELAARAKRDLRSRVAALLDTERDRWLSAVPHAPSGAAARDAMSQVRGPQ